MHIGNSDGAVQSSSTNYSVPNAYSAQMQPGKKKDQAQKSENHS